jgi:hypothetical protein
MDICIGQTGVRDGEYVEGIGKQTKGVKMQVRFCNGDIFPPLLQFFNASDPKQRNLHLLARDVLTYGFFQGMSVEERENWVESNKRDIDLYLSDVNCEVRFLSLGDCEFSKGDKLSEESRQLLMGGQYLPMSQVYHMFPSSGSKARRHSLIFRPSNWRLFNAEAAPNYSFYVNLLSGECSKEKPLNLQVYKSEIEVNGKKHFVGVCDEIPFASVNEIMDPVIKSKLDWFSPSIHKSLMQKCIRARPVQVNHFGEIFSTEDVLITSFLMLLTHPGCFVPNLNTFVCGAESALKRLAVSLIEDASCSLEASLSLFAAALAARQDQYKPSLKFVEKCIQWALQGLLESYYEYDVKKRANLSGASSKSKAAVSFIDALGSFESDIHMITDVISKGFSAKKSELPRPLEMPLYHCLDQHSICEIAHFYVGEELEAKYIFQKIWREGTGINSRKKAFKVNAEVAKAQELLWISKTSVAELKRECEGCYEGKMSLSESWIAGLIGAIPLKIDRMDVLAFFDPENIDKVVVIRRPSRDNDCHLTEDIKVKAAREVISKYKHNSVHYLKVNKNMLNNGFAVQYKDGDFMCGQMFSPAAFKWSEYCKSSFQVPLLREALLPSFDDFECQVKLAYGSFSDGVASDALERIDSYIRQFDSSFLMRLGMYLRPVKSELSVHKLSRDGSGTYLMSDANDSKIFRFFIYLCAIIPGVMKAVPSLMSFRILNFPYWDMVRKQVFKMIEQVDYPAWSVTPKCPQVLWPNQSEAVSSILDRISAGKRGSMLWMDVGLGKTQIVLSIIGSLIQERRMPKYCFFVLTPSSYANIMGQIRANGLSVNMLDPRAASRNLSVKANCVNVLNHDHMDDMHALLKSYAANSFFLFDEVHYMFGDSKRSSVALELAKTCNLFVAMSGTLVRNKDIARDNIIEWLGQVVDFEINADNYMIGVASLIAFKKELPIKQNRIEVEVPVLDNSYYDYVDASFGGRSSVVNYHKAAMICFESVYHGIVERVKEHKRQNHGCVFVVAKDRSMQQRLYDELSSFGMRCFAVTSGNSISITSASNPQNIEVVIATPRQETGYDVTAAKYMITAPYPSNEASRTQLVGRIVRLSQESPEVFIEIVHCGILTYSMRYHEIARMIAKSLSGMQKDV